MILPFQKTRKELGLVQGDVAEAIGCGQGTISKIEQGELVGEYFIKYLQFLNTKGVDMNHFIPPLKLELSS